MKQSQGAGASGYLGWSLYFPFEEFSPEDMASRATLIDGLPVAHYHTCPKGALQGASD